MRNLRPLIVTALLSVLLATPAFAQTTDEEGGLRGDIAYGFRAGYTSWNGLNQIHIGAHLKLGEIFPNVQFTPNLEAGFGDGANIVTVNGDVVYSFTEFFEHPWNLYGGGALSFNYLNPDGFGSTTDLGLSAVVGMERTLANGHESLVEIRVGIMDSPDFKLTFGYTFF